MGSAARAGKRKPQEIREQQERRPRDGRGTLYRGTYPVLDVPSPTAHARCSTARPQTSVAQSPSANVQAPLADIQNFDRKHARTERRHPRADLKQASAAVSRPTAEVLGPTNRSFEGRRCGSELQRWSPEPGVAFRTLKEPPQAPAPTAVGIVPGKTQPRPSCKRRVMLYRALFVMTARKCARQPNVAPRKRSLWARYGKFIAGALP